MYKRQCDAATHARKILFPDVPWHSENCGLAQTPAGLKDMSLASWMCHEQFPFHHGRVATMGSEFKTTAKLGHVSGKPLLPPHPVSGSQAVGHLESPEERLDVLLPYQPLRDEHVFQ